MSGRPPRGRQRVDSGQTVRPNVFDGELGVLVEGLRLQRDALHPELADPVFGGELAEMARLNKAALVEQVRALEFAQRLLRGEVRGEDVDQYIRGATSFGALGEQAVMRVRGERES